MRGRPRRHTARTVPDFLAIPPESHPLEAQGRHGDHQPHNRDDAMHGASPKAKAHPTAKIKSQIGRRQGGDYLQSPWPPPTRPPSRHALARRITFSQLGEVLIHLASARLGGRVEPGHGEVWRHSSQAGISPLKLRTPPAIQTPHAKRAWRNGRRTGLERLSARQETAGVELPKFGETLQRQSRAKPVNGKV